MEAGGRRSPIGSATTRPCAVGSAHPIAHGASESGPHYLPSKIANALVRVYEALHEFALTQTQRQVLACLVRNGVKQQDPVDWIFMKKVTIARRLGLSEATVYRCLAALEGAGLIEREEQRQSTYNLKALGRIRLSVQAIRNLGLASTQPSPEMGATARTPDIQNQGATRRMPDLAPVRDVNVHPQQSSSKKQSPGTSPFIRVLGKAVPSELAWLVTQNGLALTGLFALMKRAKAVGHRLSNVIAVVRDALIPLKGRELFAYIQALLSKTVDYAFVAEQQATQAQAERAKAEAAAAVTAEISDLVSRLRGVQVTRADGAVLSVDEASVVIEKAGRRAAAPHALAFDLLREMAACQANDGKSAFARPCVDPFERGQSLAVMEAQLAAARGILRGRSSPAHLTRCAARPALQNGEG
ncbi:helix-turn-helix transcriptional regulator [Cupriavidus sp. D39]|uniref:helix-turn-helix transcriptional regulator n=1 Tax=Cupriavidus sp. D39 TaxID=2997877 RepID=UPI002271136B|nr:helix-turn-helix domain-containing protein [Cupriavidus sp. D39]MCY0852644.1 MarR family transcriptional regulator [Cupriavidus sp. D39]